LVWGWESSTREGTIPESSPLLSIPIAGLFLLKPAVRQHWFSLLLLQGSLTDDLRQVKAVLSCMASTFQLCVEFGSSVGHPGLLVSLPSHLSGSLANSALRASAVPQTPQAQIVLNKSVLKFDLINLSNKCNKGTEKIPLVAEPA